MPRNYQSQGLRQQWSAEEMDRAVSAVKNGDCSENHAAKVYGVPRQTLRRYLHKDAIDLESGKSSKLGRKCELGERAEQILVEHIKKLSRHGFSLCRNDVRSLAFNLAENLKLEHRFNKEEGLAGWDWLWGFLKRHPRLSIRKEENLSIARALGMKREEVYSYFDLLEEMIAKLNLINKPDRIFGLDESGFQLNTRAKEVIAPKGDRVVHSIAPKEKGETISIIGCFNAAGSYLPPCLIVKGVRTIIGLKERLPPGSEVFMNGKSAYATGFIFHEVLKHFVSYFRVSKEDPVLLILDGHDSHCSYPEALDYAAENGVHMICFPPHTTNWLQPADKSLFGPLKKAYYDGARRFVRQHRRAFTKIEFGDLVKEAWEKVSTIRLATCAFRATGIWPPNRDAIPNHAYISEYEDLDQVDDSGISKPSTTTISTNPSSTVILSVNLGASTSEKLPNLGPATPTKVVKEIEDTAPTPRKTINKLSPLPSLKEKPPSNRGKKRGVSRELTSKEAIDEVKRRKFNTAVKRKIMENKKNKKVKKQVTLADDNCMCPLCGGNYSDDVNGEKWIRCENCSEWSHEECVDMGEDGVTFLCENCK